ncbi:MAG: hypothetical protein ACRDI2_06840, partial [Chloroflexota bacterium]
MEGPNPLTPFPAREGGTPSGTPVAAVPPSPVGKAGECPQGRGPAPGRGLGLVLIAPFARYPKSTTSARVLPLARALASRGHTVTVLVPPYDHPEEGGQVSFVG